MKKVISIFVILILTVLLLTGCSRNEESNSNFKVVTSFYPIYIATLNITDGVDNVIVENMTSENAGCLHEYSLKATDMVKIENADVFIQNGMNLENFMDKILTTYPNLNIIDTSKNISANNPHLWVNVDFYIKQIENIKQGLIELNPENATIFETNANNYIEEIYNEIKILNIKENISAITFNETLENISSNMEITLIETGHEETALSAEKLSTVINKMNSENIDVILVDKNESYRNAEILRNETSAKIYEIDSYTKGTLEKDAYINALRNNIQILNSI